MRRACAVLVAAVAIAPACKRAAPPCPGGRIALVAPTAPVGFDAQVSIQVKALCAEASAGTIAWRQVEGSAARAVTPAPRGMGLRARTPTLAEAFGAPLPWGLVPLSPRTQGALAFEATWTDGRGGTERHTARVVAAARSRGVANAPLGARLYLGGAGWRLDERPPLSAAAITSEGGAASLLPDAAGDYRLKDGAGRPLTLRASRYDATALDCGRSGCHVEVARASESSPMTTVLSRGIVPAPGAASVGRMARFGAGYPECALACHATGDPGVADGGFTHVHEELSLGALGPRAWDSVPGPLRRLGGVGCLACHGPGALPEASSRWSILRADVCATCHDAPPRYGHAAAWRTTAMARADRDERTGREPACARCHTTWGFLASLPGAAAPVDRRPPADVGAVGLTCAACHAVHDPATARPAPHLLRRTPLPAVLAGAPLPPAAETSRVCLGCHAPDPAEGAPSAAAAALWLGRGGLDPASGRPLEAAAVHGAVAGGCVGCHRSGGDGLQRGAGHAFVATRANCAGCHPKGLPDEDLAARARALWAALPADARAAEGAGPLHARAPRLDRGTPLGRAAWNISLVLEDRAAAAHNAPYARQLLAAAEKALNGRAPR